MYPPPAGAAHPGDKNGRIAFTYKPSDDGSDDGVSTVQPAGSERRFVHEVHRRLRELIGVHLASGSEPSVFALSRRLMQTLALLLQGAGEKTIAARLELSRSTVHQYVLALYRHFGTTNRSEILARWIRLGPSLMLPAELSPRQGETLERVLRGESDREIAAGLGLSIHTVREHVTALYRRFRVKSRAELIARWIRIDPAILEQDGRVGR